MSEQPKSQEQKTNKKNDKRYKHQDKTKETTRMTIIKSEIDAIRKHIIYYDLEIKSTEQMLGVLKEGKSNKDFALVISIVDSVCADKVLLEKDGHENHIQYLENKFKDLRIEFEKSLYSLNFLKKQKEDEKFKMHMRKNKKHDMMAFSELESYPKKIEHKPTTCACEECTCTKEVNSEN